MYLFFAAKAESHPEWNCIRKLTQISSVPGSHYALSACVYVLLARVG